MHQLPHYRTKKITLWLSLASIMVFGTLIALQAYSYHEDTPKRNAMPLLILFIQPRMASAGPAKATCQLTWTQVKSTSTST